MKMDITISAKQVISPDVMQFLELTKMTSWELSAFLTAQATENPIIDIDALPEAPFADHAQESIEWLSSYYSGQREAKTEDPDKPEAFSFGDSLASAPRLKDYLRFQLSSIPLTKTEESIAKYPIDCVDKNGYLHEDISLAAKLLEADPGQVEKCVSILRGLSPAGVCAADMKSCLLAQLDPDSSDPLIPVVREIIENHLSELARGSFSGISKKLRIPAADVQAAAERIGRLHPYPSAGFDSDTPNHYVYPDISVDNVNGELQVSLLSEFSPYLRVNRYYLELYKSTDDPETREYLDRKLRAAYQLFKNVSQREETILRCAKQIALIQKDWFLSPAAVLLPMTLSDVAGALDISLSTVSRALSGKYIQCCHGVVPARALFTVKMKTTSYAAVSSDEVKAVIKSIVDGEDKRAPLSDAQISSVCRHRGFVVSRRTVAKYRAGLGIPAASARKQFGK